VSKLAGYHELMKKVVISNGIIIDICYSIAECILYIINIAPRSEMPLHTLGPADFLPMKASILKLFLRIRFISRDDHSSIWSIYPFELRLW
jgi:hypothetical protein